VQQERTQTLGTNTSGLNYGMVNPHWAAPRRMKSAAVTVKTPKIIEMPEIVRVVWIGASPRAGRPVLSGMAKRVRLIMSHLRNNGDLVWGVVIRALYVGASPSAAATSRAKRMRLGRFWVVVWGPGMTD
jgi:hypothetical protein